MRLKINQPETLDDITLRQYQEFYNIEEPTHEDYLRIFLNLPIEQVRRIKQKDVASLVESIKEVLNQEATFTPTFILNGVKFGFIPKLDDITLGENNDLTGYLKNPNAMHKAMAVMYRPVIQSSKGKYLIEKYDGKDTYYNTMLDTPVSIYAGAVVFFCNLMNDLLTFTQKSLKNDLTEKIIAQEALQENGDSTRKSLSLLMNAFPE